MTDHCRTICITALSAERARARREAAHCEAAVRAHAGDPDRVRRAATERDRLLTIEDDCGVAIAEIRRGSA